MPFESEAQRRFMYAKHPRMAKRWQKHTPKGKKLPDKKSSLNTIGGRHVNKLASVEDRLAHFLSTGQPHPSVKEAGIFQTIGQKVTRGAGKVGIKAPAKYVGAVGKEAPKAVPKGGIFASSTSAKTRGESAKAYDSARPKAIKSDSEKRLGNIGKGTVAAGGVAAAGAGGAAYAASGKDDKDKEKKKDEEKKAEMGTPFTDGFLQFCLNNQFDGQQVADMLEKGAAVEGQVGTECQGLLDRMLATQE